MCMLHQIDTQKALEMLSETGFADVNVQNLDHDFQNNYYIANKK